MVTNLNLMYICLFILGYRIDFCEHYMRGKCKIELDSTVNMRSYVMTDLHYVPSLFISMKVLLLFSIYNILLAGLRWLSNPSWFQDIARK